MVNLLYIVIVKIDLDKENFFRKLCEMFIIYFFFYRRKFFEFCDFIYFICCYILVFRIVFSI